MSETALAEPPLRLAHVRGIADYWMRKTLRADLPRPRGQADAMLLDALGLGLEQTLIYLGGERPSLAAFDNWIFDTTGTPDPLAVARYNAWWDGTPPPPELLAVQAEIMKMPPVLDAADLARWERDGYVVLHAAITREEARAAEDLLWRTVGAMPDDPASWYASRAGGIMVQLFQHPALEPARRSRRVHKAFAQLWGHADLWATTDRLSFNPPQRPGKPFPGPHLHWDSSLAQPVPFAAQGMVYLTDTSADQGALRVVPGFHHRLEGWLETLDGADPRKVDFSGEAIGISAGAGDLIIWRQELPHGASPNHADRPRMAQYVTMYAPDLEPNPVWL